jgi:uracil-DNA glycosylase
MKADLLKAIADRAEACSSCSLREGRNKCVPGEGNPDARVIWLGEAPGATENETGHPFCGRAGKLLDNIIISIGLKREDVYIVNICKCRPPNNRKPTPEEMAACIPFLKEQIEIIRPEVIVAMGATAVEGLLGPGLGITKRHGNWEEFNEIPVMVTFHPSALLRKKEWKDLAWYDLQSVKEKLGL